VFFYHINMKYLPIVLFVLVGATLALFAKQIGNYAHWQQSHKNKSALQKGYFYVGLWFILIGLFVFLMLQYLAWQKN
jgi:hypothetical protein